MMNAGSDSARRSAKRVAGGLGFVVRKKKSQGSSGRPAARTPSSIPTILTSIPDESCAMSSEDHKLKTTDADDEFGDVSCLRDTMDDIPGDTLMCLQAYTRPTHGIVCETCAYCPIFSHEQLSVSSDAVRSPATMKSKTTHAAPFLTRPILFHLSSKNLQTIGEIEQLAASNKIRLLQLHGTTIERNETGWRSYGNDDDDVAVMEILVYETAAEMALLACALGDKRGSCSETRAKSIHGWFTSVLMPHFSSTTWFTSSSMETFFRCLSKKKSIGSRPRRHSISNNNPPCDKQWSVGEMTTMIEELVHAGLLLPRRGLGLDDGEGYWFSLPGLGRAAKSIAEGRLSILRRIQSSKFKEKKRSTLEQDVDRKVNPHVKPSDMEHDRAIAQAGKFLVLDLLSKGLVYVHQTCTEEQFIRVTRLE